MRYFRKVILSLFVFMALFFNGVTNVHANEDIKLENFIATSLEYGYLNSSVSIEQIRGNKYEVQVLFTENIMGINYGFYLTPTIIDTLKAAGFESTTRVTEIYAITFVSLRTNNLQDTLNRLSVLPFVDFEYYIDEENKDQIIKGVFQEDFFSEEKKENELIREIFNSNKHVIQIKPHIEEYSSSDANLMYEGGYHTWIKSKDVKDTSFNIILYNLDGKTAFLYNATYYGGILLVALIILITIYFIIRKLINKFGSKKINHNNYNHYNNYDNYNDHNDYEDYDDYNNYKY